MIASSGITLGGASGGLCTIKAAASGAWTLTMPTAVPAVTGYVLSCTTAGVASWVVQGTPASYTLTAGTGLSGTTASSVLAAVSLSVDQAFTPTWTGTHDWRQTVGNTVIQMRRTGESNSRLLFNVDGGMYWGSGSASWDVGLIRKSVGYAQFGWDANAGGLVVATGIAAQYVVMGGIMHTDFTTVTATAAEITLHTFSVLGNAFYNDGDALFVESFGSSSGGNGVPRIDLYFDGTSYLNISGVTATTLPWHLKAQFIRQSSTVIAYVASINYSTTLVSVVTGTITGLDLTTTKIVKVTGQSTNSSNVPKEYSFICSYSSAGIS